MRVRIHHGAHEIGGSCIEVEFDGARLVLDVGKPLSAAPGEHVPLPDVPGLRDGGPGAPLAVLISHPHLDHYGLVDQVHPAVPVYCGREAAALVNAARFFSPAGPALTPTGHLVDGVPLQLGRFTMTPHLVDHSGLDAYALVIEAGGRRLMYTGDLRGHGRKARLFEGMVTDPPHGIDTLLLEGTHVRPGTPKEPPVLHERDVERQMTAVFQRTSGLPVVVSSAQNVDRLVTVYRAARRAGRTLLVDLYTATVAQALGRPTIPQPGSPELGVYVPRRQRVRVQQSGEFHRTRAVREHRVYPEQLRADPGRFVVLTGSAAVAELLDGGACRGGVVLWSLWEGYLAEESGQRLFNHAAAMGVPVEHCHTSGHASVRDLQRLVRAIAPGQVVPIHTEGAAEYVRHFAAVTPRSDGAWWPVGGDDE